MQQIIKSFRTPRGTIVIRPVNLGDVPQFRELRLHALMDSPTAFSADYKKTSSYPMKYWEETLTLDANESSIFIAENNHRLIGMTGIVRGRSPKTRHAADIWGVFVKAEWRGLHIAEELINACIEWAKTREIILLRLAVVALNTAAVRCYQRCGFTTYGTEPRALLYKGTYYDEFMMSLALDQIADKAEK